MNKEQLGGFISGKTLQDYVSNLDKESKGYYKTSHYGFLEEYLNKEFKRLSEDELFKAGMGVIIGSSIAGFGTIGCLTGNHYGSLISVLGVALAIYSFYKFKNSTLHNNKEVFEQNLQSLTDSLK